MQSCSQWTVHFGVQLNSHRGAPGRSDSRAKLARATTRVNPLWPVSNEKGKLCLSAPRSPVALVEVRLVVAERLSVFGRLKAFRIMHTTSSSCWSTFPKGWVVR